MLAHSIFPLQGTNNSKQKNNQMHLLFLPAAKGKRANASISLALPVFSMNLTILLSNNHSHSLQWLQTLYLSFTER